MRVRACVRACVCVCMHMCTWGGAGVPVQAKHVHVQNLPRERDNMTGRSPQWREINLDSYVGRDSGIPGRPWSVPAPERKGL